MATPGINTKIKLDGEAEYRAALSSIDKSFRELGSEMNLLSAKFSENGDSMEALSAKSEVLSKKVDAQQKRVDTLKKAVAEAQSIQEKAQKTFDETASTLDAGSKEYKDMSEQVQKAADQTAVWQTKLNNAEAELYKMKDALEENNAELDKAGASGSKFQQAMDKVKDSVAKAKEEGTGAKGVFANLKESFADSKGEAVGLGDALGGAADKLGIQLPEGASKALNSLNGINAGTAAVIGGFGALIAAGVKVEKQLMSITKESAEYAKEVKTLASVTGQSVEEVQEWQYASDMLGVTYDRVKDSLKEITNKMQEAQNGSEDTAGAFKTLSVEIENTDGSLRSADAVFYDVIDSLGNMHNQAQRDALAMDLMSESAQELNPLIEVGSEGLKKYTDEAHEMGYVLDNEAVEALAATDAAQQKLLKTQEAVTKQISAEYAPYMTEALGDTADFIQKIGKAFVESGVVDKFGSILSSATQILEPLGDLTVAVLPALDAALKPVATTMALIADTTNLLVGLLTLNGDKIKTALGLNMSSGQLSNMQQLQYKGALSSGSSYVSGMGYTGTGGYMGADGKWHQNAAGTDNFIGGVTWVGENGPEPVWLPQGSRIGTNQEGRSLSGGDTYNFIVQANEIREIDDFIRRMKNQRRVSRMGVM